MLEFTNEKIDIDLLPKYEEVALDTVSTKYWNIILINIVFFSVFCAFIIAALLVLNIEARNYAYFILFLYIAFTALLIFIYKISFKRRGYAVREKDFIYRSGIVAISTTLVPFNRIQHIALEEGIFSRIYKLGSLQIFTAGGSSGTLHLRGLEIEDARRIKELLMKQIKEINS